MTSEEIIAIVKKPRNDELYHTKSFIQIEEIPYTECPGAEEYNTCFRITYPYFPDSVHLFLRDAAGNTFLGDEQGLIYLTMTDGGTFLKYCEENGVEPSDTGLRNIVYQFQGFDIDGEEIVVYPFPPDEFDKVFLEGWMGCGVEFGNVIDKKGYRAVREMGLTDIDKLINNLGPYLKAKIKRARIPMRVGDTVELELPFKNRRGDNIQIYIQQRNDGTFYFSDGRVVSDGFFEDGVNIMSREIEEIAGCFDVEFDASVLSCTCSPDDFSETLFRFIRALTVLDYLAVTKEYPKYISNRPAH